VDLVDALHREGFFPDLDAVSEFAKQDHKADPTSHRQKAVFF